MIICGEENGLLTSPYCQFWQFCCWHDVLVLFQNPAWQAQTDTAVSLWVSRAKYQLHLRSSSWSFCSDSPEWRSAHMCTWFWRHGDAFGATENAFFSCIYNPQIIILPTSSCTASFNRNQSCQKSPQTLDLSFNVATVVATTVAKTVSTETTVEDNSKPQQDNRSLYESPAPPHSSLHISWALRQRQRGRDVGVDR